MKSAEEKRKDAPHSLKLWLQEGKLDAPQQLVLGDFLEGKK